MHWLRRRFHDLDRLEMFRLQFLAYLRIVCLSFPVDKYLEQVYANKYANSKLIARLDSSGSLNKFSYSKQETFIDRVRQALDDPGINPQLVLRSFRLFHAVRVFTTFYFVYALTKFIITEELLQRMLAIRFPIHCYLTGRLVLHKNFEKTISGIFAVLHLSWRLYQSIQPENRISLLDFCLLSEHELEMIYSQLEHAGSIRLDPIANKKLSPRSRQVLEIMCFKIKRDANVIYKLRPNRTRESHKLLCRLVAYMTIAITAVFMAFAVSITSIIVPLLLSNESYLDRSPGCDLEMELQRKQGKLPWFSVTAHRIYLGFMDFFENSIMYSEGALMTYIGMSCMILLNLDLVLLWKGIDKKINRLYDLTQGHHTKWTNKLERNSIISRSTCIEQGIQELIAAIWDFFGNMSRADEVISPFISGLIISSMIVCSLFTLSLHQNHLKDLPIEVTSVLLFILCWIVSAICGFLVIHHYCRSSYTKFCSLVAHDSTKIRHRYEPILEFYKENRSCFTLMKQRPLQPTAFLAMIGWTFSCFAIISSLLREKGGVQQD